MAITAIVALLVLPGTADASHTPTTSWGTPAPNTAGDAPGEIKDPSGIDTDALDNVYVADYGNNRVQKFSSDGELMSDWGTGGAVSGFDQPVDVAVTAAGVLYVADRANNRIQRFSSTGAFLGQWTVAGPRALATDDSGNVYVSDYANSLVRKYDATGTPDPVVPSFGTAQYTGIDVYGTTVFVTDFVNNEVERWTTGGSPIDAWGTSDLTGPSNVSVTEDGSNVFVADTLNRVQEFTVAGTLLAHTLGAGNGTLGDPQGVATGSLDSVFVSDLGGNRIVKYSAPQTGSTVRVSGSRLIFEGSGSDNVVSVTKLLSEYRFTVALTDTVAHGAGCTQNGANEVKCDPPGLTVTALRFALGGGNDTLTVTPTIPTVIDGGLGNDTLTGAVGGNDVASYASASGAVTVNLAAAGPQATGGAGTDTLSGFEGLAGSDFADTLTGDAGPNSIAGRGGTDEADYSAASGAVTVNLTTGQATGAAGADTLSGIEDVTGGPGNDTLTGSSATNVVAGGPGDDAINVQDTGADQANCGAGAADSATVDAQDTTSDCETVIGSTPGGGTGGGGGGGPAPALPGTGGGGGGGPLVISGLGASKMRSGKPGTFRYTVSLAARVTISIDRAGPGRKAGTACKKQTRKNRKKRKCTFYGPVGKLTYSGQQGANTAKFTGKLGGKALKPGSYRITAVGQSTTGAKSAPVTAKLTVTK